MPEANGTCRGSWGNACDLQTALGQAVSGDQIWAAEGIYYPGPTGNYTATFQLKSGVALYGGFSGIETEREQRDWETNITGLSGDIDRNDVTDPHGVVTDTAKIAGKNSYHVVSSTEVTETAVLDGFTITAGNAAGGWSYETTTLGGGMYNENGSPTLSNVIFSGNATNCDGGGMHSSGNPTLSNVSFYNNFAGSNGGGMDSSGNPTLFNVNFSNNRADGAGGGMVIDFDTSPSLFNVNFSYNRSQDGGGMASYGHPNLSNVTFYYNSAGWYGGGMISSSCPSLSNVTFYHNFAVWEGGGMYVSGCPSLSNVTFSMNEAGYGGGMYNYYGNPSLSNVTFFANRATSVGGIFNYFGSPTLANTILWGNNPGQIYNYDSNNTATITYSDIQGGYPGQGNIDEDPLLGPLVGNRGITWTHALLSGSPAIDSGDPQNCPATDQRRVARPVDGDQDGVAICDMGAYEYDPLAITQLVYLPLIQK